MVRRQTMADRALRPAMRSPGRPIPARHVEREFWRLIAQGKRTEEAAIGVGVSVPVGSRWFRHAGGMAALPLAEPSGRYLSFTEREELRCCERRVSGCAPLPGRWAVTRQRSRGSYAAMPRRAAGSSSIGRRWRSGRHRPQPSDPSRRSWPRTRGCTSTCANGSAASSSAPTGLRCVARRRPGRA